jgi:hypothetical protein
MPIFKENKDRYPANWKEISDRIREREGHKCKWCDAPNGIFIYRPDKDSAQWKVWPEGMESEALSIDGYKPIKIVLTVAHLDHIPENCSDDNLAALCQRCYNRYDMPNRVKNRKEKKLKAQPELCTHAQ